MKTKNHKEFKLERDLKIRIEIKSIDESGQNEWIAYMIDKKEKDYLCTFLANKNEKITLKKVLREYMNQNINKDADKDADFLLNKEGPDLFLNDKPLKGNEKI